MGPLDKGGVVCVGGGAIISSRSFNTHTTCLWKACSTEPALNGAVITQESNCLPLAVVGRAVN